MNSSYYHVLKLNLKKGKNIRKCKMYFDKPPLDIKPS